MSSENAGEMAGAKVAVSGKQLKHLYIAWVSYQRRPDSMRSYVGYELLFMPPPFAARWAKPFGYMKQAVDSIAAIWRVRPDVVWFQMPPTFIVHLMILLRPFLPPVKFVADCHNSALDADIPGNSWPKMPFYAAMLNRCQVVLAHNSEVAKKAIGLGVDPGKLKVLETRPAQVSASEGQTVRERPLILVPCSYRDDEPIDVVLDAARLMPQADFRLTGNRDKAAAKGFVSRAPENVAFTGFLSTEDYTKLLTSCSVLWGITVSEGIQLSGANEAVGAGRPMVLSDTKILRELFGAAAVFSANESGPAAAALTDAVNRQEELAAKSVALKSAREQRWRSQVQACLELLN